MISLAPPSYVGQLKKIQKGENCSEMHDKVAKAGKFLTVSRKKLKMFHVSVNFLYTFSYSSVKSYMIFGTWHYLPHALGEEY